MPSQLFLTRAAPRVWWRRLLIFASFAAVAQILIGLPIIPIVFVVLAVTIVRTWQAAALGRRGRYLVLGIFLVYAACALFMLVFPRFDATFSDALLRTANRITLLGPVVLAAVGYWTAMARTEDPNEGNAD
jgi:hypothetical protein